MGRTKHNKPKRKRTLSAEKKAIIPPYKVGDIIQRNAQKDKLVIMEDHKLGSLKVKEFLLMNLVSRHVYYEGYQTPKNLWLFDYEIVGHMDLEEIHSILHPVSETKQKVERGERCPEFPLEDCEIVKGKNPLKRGEDVHFKGTTVVGLKVRCPICQRKVRVTFNKRDKMYHSAKHTTWQKNVEVKRRRTKFGKAKRRRTK